MTLKEISVGYRENARRLDLRIHQLKLDMELTEDPGLRSQYEERIKVLSTMLRESRELAVMCERYYERGYRRNAKYTL